MTTLILSVKQWKLKNADVQEIISVSFKIKFLDANSTTKMSSHQCTKYIYASRSLLLPSSKVKS